MRLDVRHHIQWRRHLVNAYEVKAGMVFFAGYKLCDPCLSALEWFVYHARRYTSALIYLFTFYPNVTVIYIRNLLLITVCSKTCNH